MSKVFIIALPEEVNYVNWINDDKIIYCGVGKINATIAACDAYKQGYNEIINIGSCGSLKHEPGTIIKVGSVFQDIDIRPLCEYGYTFNELNKDSEFRLAFGLKYLPKKVRKERKAKR